MDYTGTTTALSFLRSIDQSTLLSSVAISSFVYLLFTYFLKEWLENRKHDFEVFSTQLKKLNELNQAYYVLYITRTIELKKQLEKKVIDDFLLFYTFAKWILIRRKWIKESNSFIILKSHTAEKLIIHLVQKQLLFFDENLFTKEDRHLLAEYLENNPSIVVYYHTLKTHIAENNGLRKIYENLQTNIKKLDRGKKESEDFIEGLDIFSRIFDSEIYHCHEAWYRNTYYPPTFTVSQQKIITDELIYLYGKQWVRLREANKFLSRIQSLYRISAFSKRVLTCNILHLIKNGIKNVVVVVSIPSHHQNRHQKEDWC